MAETFERIAVDEEQRIAAYFRASEEERAEIRRLYAAEVVSSLELAKRTFELEQY